MTIHRISLVCNSSHWIASMPYDTAVTTGQEAQTQLDSHLIKYKIDRVCQKCGSARVKYESELTDFETLEDCQPPASFNSDGMNPN